MIEQEQQLDQILEEGALASENKKVEVIYYRPKFYRRILANFIDILIFILIFVGLFSLGRYIMTNSEGYKNNFNAFNKIRVDSGLYVKDSGEIKDIITYLDGDSKNNSEYKMKKARQAIENFIAYSHTVCSESGYTSIVNDYDSYRLKPKMIYKNKKSEYNGTLLFVLDEDNNVIENPELFAVGSYVPNIYNYFYNKAYKPYIDKQCQGFLTTKIPNYFELTKYMALMLIFAAITPSYLLTGILVYYVPTLCFRRGRCTLGKALYRIGLVDRRVLSPTFARTTARFAILYFAVIILSVVTFGLPMLISFSLMVFSKGKQGFPDYMLGLTEIDMSRTKIYKSFDEADFDKIDSHKKAVDFRVPNFD